MRKRLAFALSRKAPLFCLIVWLCSFLTAQAQRYPFYNVGIEQGLIQSQATCMAQDEAGHLWTGTLGGLSRYDGQTFTGYSVRDGLPDNTINTLQAGISGQLWIGTKKGLSCYDGKKFRNYIFQSAENPQGNNVTAIKVMADGTVWCIAGKQIYSLINSRIQSISFPAPYKNATAIHTDEAGRLWVAFPGSTHLYNYTNRQWDSIPLPQATAPYYISRIATGRNGKTWMISNNGLLKWRGTGISKTAFPAAIKDRAFYATCLTEAIDSSLWLGTSSGAIRINDTSYRYYNKQNGFTDNAVYSALTDAEGNIWMSTDGQGLFRFSGAPFIAIEESATLPSAQIMAIAAADDLTLCFGTYDAGLYQYKENTITKIPFPGNITPPIISLAYRYGHELWIGTRNAGLWKYDHGFTHYTSGRNGLPSDQISSLYLDKDHKLWIGFLNGAAVYDGDHFTTIPIDDAVIFDFLSVGTDSMLLATGNGIKLYHAGNISSFITGTAADSATPECFALQGNRLWIGTSDNGAICYDLQQHQSFVINKSNGLRSDFVYNIYAAPDGSVWAGTGFGIYNIVLNGPKPAVTFYGRDQGVTGMESNHNAVLGLPDGTIWFGTTNGAMQYRPGSRKMNAHPVSIVMQSVKLFGEQVTDSSYFSGSTANYNVPTGLRLPPSRNNLTFNFQAISLSDKSGITYRYRMDGLDAPWSDWAPTNTITYPALPSGKYTLRIQCSINGQRTNLELNYSFEIITPFHKTTLFRFILFGGCILLGVSLQYIANRNRQARLNMMDNLRKEEQEKMRERTAEDFHDEVGNKITRINVLTNVLKARLGDLPPDARRIIDQINDNTGQLYSGTRDILWSLNPGNDNLYELLHRIRDFGRDLFGDTEIRFDFTGTGERWKDHRLPMDMSRNLIMIFKEAMNNSLKYAQPDLVTLTAVAVGDNRLQLTLTDNGSGFDATTVKRGNGLNNMAVRAKRIHGDLVIRSATGKGTIIMLTFSIPQNK